MLAKVISSAVVGLDAVPIEVEIDIASQGLPNFFIVGLPELCRYRLLLFTFIFI